jgi:hypothetical protein
MLLSYQSIAATSVFQEPDQNRVFKDDFKDRYSGRKYNYEGKKIVNKTPGFDGEFADYEAKRRQEKLKEKEEKEKNANNDISFNLGPFSFLFYGILIAAVIYLVYVLLNDGSSGLFSRRQHQKLEGSEDITAENIERTDIDYLIESAENNSDYRLAIRYYYLNTLKALGLKKHIQIEDDKTNSEYLSELYNTPYKDKFQYTSYLYDYIWYGEFPLNAEKYEAAKIHFQELIKQVK